MGSECPNSSAQPPLPVTPLLLLGCQRHPRRHCCYRSCPSTLLAVLALLAINRDRVAPSFISRPLWSFSPSATITQIRIVICGLHLRPDRPRSPSSVFVLPCLPPLPSRQLLAIHRPRLNSPVILLPSNWTVIWVNAFLLRRDLRGLHYSYCFLRVKLF
ncbi:hypothetical protein K1719_032695 [Acacia pycnantha]|nr:hypothetical protein K1719_032695 [Acacia pycnantha]